MNSGQGSCTPAGVPAISRGLTSAAFGRNQIKIIPTDGWANPRIKKLDFDFGSARQLIRGIACVELTGHPWD
jgi:hypothetical protein